MLDINHKQFKFTVKPVNGVGSCRMVVSRKSGRRDKAGFLF